MREYADPGLLVELAVEAEAAGWDGVFVWDHIAREEDPSVPATDPWIAVAGMAARTQRVRLGIMVTPLARRRPWKVAREAVAVDALSGGRFTLGVGLGGGPNAEFAAFGEDPDPRVRADRLDEGLAILDGLWSGEPLQLRGRAPSRHRRALPAAAGPAAPHSGLGRGPLAQPPPVPARGAVGRRLPGLRRRRVGRDADAARRWPRRSTTPASTGPRTAGPFDVALESASAGEDRAADAALAADYERAGLTWWIEALGWFRGPLEAMRERVRRGPPRALSG